MITRLRRNFILVAMCSMATVLAVIVGTLNLVSYWNMVARADSILDILAENDAAFPDMKVKGLPVMELPMEGDFADDGANQSDVLKNDVVSAQRGEPGERRGFLDIQGMSPETPYETRYFSVKLNESGQVSVVDTGKIAAVESDDAVEMAQEIWESGKTSGFCDSYRYKVVEEEESAMILFVDRSRELASIQALALASVSVSVLGLLAVLVLVIIFSKRVFLPVAAGYEKQKQFITDASHELKTPLTIISANVEVLELEAAEREMQPGRQGMECAEEESAEGVIAENTWLKSIKNQVSRLTVLVEQLVALSRMDERNELQDAADFSLSDAVLETAELFRQPAENKGIQLEMVVQENCIYHGEERLIRQMVSLMTDNAVKYSPQDGQIRVSLKQKGKHCLFTVWNTAGEIPRGNLDILFERFYRLDSSHNSGTGGSGIGLSIVKSIVDAHKGKITACSEDGRSLQIEVVL